MSNIPPQAKLLIAKILRWGGVELHRYSHSLRATRARVLAGANVDVVLDVGANTGQYARELRATGYRGRIVSFEPLPEAFAELHKQSTNDPMWDARRLAIGESDETVTLNIARNSVSSSVLPMLSQHEEAAPNSAYVGTSEVPMARLDSIESSIFSEGEHAHLKLDVQGYEMSALEGAESTLSHVASVEVELSVVPLYEGQVLMSGIIDFLAAAGFQLIWVERGFLDPRTSHMLQLDGLFLRHDKL